MFPTLSSVAAIGSHGVVNAAANILHVKTSVNFNFKRTEKNGVIKPLALVKGENEKLEFFC
jgi:hypothetical protein